MCSGAGRRGRRVGELRQPVRQHSHLGRTHLCRRGLEDVHGSVAAPAVESRSPTFDNFEHPPLAKYLFGLAQLVVGHSDITADRVVAAICTLLTAVVAGWLMSLVAGLAF